MNDPQKIKEATGYYSGNVYIYDKGNDENNKRFESPERYDDPLTYDPGTGNFHIVPNNTYFIELVGEARKSIIDKLKNEFSGITTKKDDENKPRLSEYAGWGSRNKFRNIEKAVQIEWKKNIYLLCFERLYAHKDKVHCMFGLFQFYKYPVDDKYVNKIKGEFSMCYPASFRDNEKLQKGEHIVYNAKLPSVFEINDNNNLKIVCEAFISFLENN